LVAVRRGTRGFARKGESRRARAGSGGQRSRKTKGRERGLHHKQLDDLARAEALRDPPQGHVNDWEAKWRPREADDDLLHAEEDLGAAGRRERDRVEEVMGRLGCAAAEVRPSVRLVDRSQHVSKGLEERPPRDDTCALQDRRALQRLLFLLERLRDQFVEGIAACVEVSPISICGAASPCRIKFTPAGRQHVGSWLGSAPSMRSVEGTRSRRHGWYLAPVS